MQKKEHFLGTPVTDEIKNVFDKEVATIENRKANAPTAPTLNIILSEDYRYISFHC